MRHQLTKRQQVEIILRLIDDLKNLPNRDVVYISSHYSHGNESKMLEKIAERSGIEYTEWSYDGKVDIAEEITIMFDWRCDNLWRKLQGIEPYSQRPEHVFPEEEISDELKLAVTEFEKKNIPSSGPCKTHLGEIFRAIQYIQYRAHNDGDICWDPGSPSFTSYIYLRKQIDKLNHSGEYGEDSDFEFNEPYLSRFSCGQISDMIEDKLALTANFMKYQLMELIVSGQIENSSNEYDSRDFTSLNRGSRY